MKGRAGWLTFRRGDFNRLSITSTPRIALNNCLTQIREGRCVKALCVFAALHDELSCFFVCLIVRRHDEFRVACDVKNVQD